MNGTEAVPVLRSQVPKALQGIEYAHPHTLGRDPQVPIQATAAPASSLCGSLPEGYLYLACSSTALDLLCLTCAWLFLRFALHITNNHLFLHDYPELSAHQPSSPPALPSLLSLLATGPGSRPLFASPMSLHKFLN